MPNQHTIGLRFTSGAYQLTGTLHLPEGVKQPPIVFGSHGLLSTGESPKQLALAHRCNEAGIAFFRFDHRGCGDSEGTFEEITSLSGRCEDLLCAVKCVCGREDIGEKIGLFGSSMGGAVCIASAGTLKPRVMVTYAAPIRSRNINEVIERESADGKAAGPLYDPASLRFDIVGKLDTLNHILVIHGDGDSVVPVSHARQIYEAAREPKKLLLQEGGDHPMSNPVHQETFITEAADWLKRFLC